ncbi:hypothetical protein, partial [Salmonella sp. s54412]|uniref:hypothetical protein n=1 Tax=Salmonella sp. s54412 TaxID=3160128 RepID=UPI0037550962
ETTGKWVDKRSKDLFLYDSGTDSAPRFVHTDTPTIPPVPIFLIKNTHEGSLKNTTIKSFGTFTFEKTSEDIPTGNKTKTTSSTPTTTTTSSTPTTTNVAIRVGYINVSSFLKLITTSLLVSIHFI